MKGKYGNLDASLISYGPCQTPTLGFCVERHDAIQTFQPEPFWTLQLLVDVSEFRKLTLDWARVRVFDREVADLFHARVQDAKQAKARRFSPHLLHYIEIVITLSSFNGFKLE